jgi:hypothetical protein
MKARRETVVRAFVSLCLLPSALYLIHVPNAKASLVGAARVAQFA